MSEIYIDTISGNTTEPQPEEPDMESGGADGEENQGNSEDAETSGGDVTESGNGGSTDDTEIVGGSPSDSQSGAVAETVGGNDSPTYGGGILPDGFRQAVDGLNAVAERMADSSPEYGDLLESVRSLVDIMTMKMETEDSVAVYASSIPISGYRDYDYPITVTWEVRPSAPNAPSRMESSETFNTPEEFETRYDAMCNMVGVSLNSFRILRIRDCSEEYVYDADNIPEEPELPEDEEPEETDTFHDDVLSALSDLHEDMQIVIYNDTLFWEQYTEMQEQYAEMQEQNTDLQYHMLASNIAIGFTLMLTLGYTIAHGFLQRMKVG